MAGPGAPTEDLPPLSAAERERYARHLLLPGFGAVAQRRLRAARVAVVGAGGLGSPVLAYLAAAGVGEVAVVDHDVVEVSNLQRQVLHGTADLGRPKVDSAADALARLDPAVRVRPVRERLVPANADRLLAGAALVVDGSDDVATRYAVADACGRLGVPEVFGAVLGFDAQVAVLWPGRGPTYRDVFPEPPSAPVPSCAEAGVLGALCGVVGSVMAVEAVKVLAGVGAPLVGRLLVLDALTMSWRTVRVRAADQPTPPSPVPARAEEPLPPGAVVAPAELARRLEAGGVTVVDVRTPAEQAVSMLPGAVAVPLEPLLAGDASALPDGPVVLHCRSGGRSERALRAVHAAGRTDVAHLDGGLLAWAREVDPSLPTT